MSNSSRGQLYKDFIKQRKNFHLSTVKNYKTLYANAPAEWNLFKYNENRLGNKLQEYSSSTMRKKGGPLKYWATKLKPVSWDIGDTPIFLTSSPLTNAVSSSPVLSKLSNNTSISSVTDNLQQEQSAPTSPKAPVQIKIIQEINDASQKLTKLYALKSTGLITSENTHLIDESEEKKKELEAELHVLKHDQERKREKRSDFQAVIHQIVDKHRDVADTLKRFKRVDPFRPRLRTGQPALLQAIIDITLSS